MLQLTLLATNLSVSQSERVTYLLQELLPWSQICKLRRQWLWDVN